MGLVGDISEMYHQVGLNEKDGSYHRFLWRDMETNEEPKVYQFKRVTFGNKASPYLVLDVMLQHASQQEKNYPQGAQVIANDMYMDDLTHAGNNITEVKATRKQVQEILKSAGFTIRKWASNDAKALEGIPKEDILEEMMIEDGSQTIPTLKTLGVMWKCKEDHFAIQTKPIDGKNTKRAVTSAIARQFDPFGFMSPFTIRAKALLQEIWAKGTDWDEELPDEINKPWERWKKELVEMKRFEIPRYLKLHKTIVNETLHIFVDASRIAFAACAYLRVAYEDNTASSALIMAKTRVAPLKSKSIPRLELDSALLGAQLANKCANALGLEVKNTTFWSDSMISLCWIRSPSRNFKEYVGNRVGLIHDITNPQQWRHIAGTNNPADLATRGIPAKDLVDNELWLHGPSFLLQPENTWPTKEIVSSKEADEEKRPTIFALATNQAIATPLIDPLRFSNWLKLARITAWIKRFKHNSLHQEKLKGALTAAEIEEAKLFWIRFAQQETFPEEISALNSNSPILKTSKIVSLNPKLDKKHILRMDGRLRKAKFLSKTTREPIILPRKHQITTLIIKDAHETLQHDQGVEKTLATLNEKYWMLRGRESVKEWKNRCNHCKKIKIQAATQIMAPLPLERLGRSMRAFDEVAVDYGGPFITKQGRGKTRMKRYLCLFTCLATRAVHLEMAWSLDTDSFLQAFTRMTNRRGLPKSVHSDNGTNMVGANNELRELILLLDQNKIGNSMANKGVQWHFNPPNAPHFGGAHEALIKSAKRAIAATISQAELTDEELLSAIAGAEGLLNSRPLTYIGNDPHDDLPLTPNHFLFGQLSGQLAPESTDETDFSPRKRWRHVQNILKHFWTRWLKEYLPRLNARTKWAQQRGDVKVDDVVLVIEPNTPRGKWHLGRITEVFPGDDGHVRVVEVKTQGVVYRRPITKICPLPLM